MYSRDNQLSIFNHMALMSIYFSIYSIQPCVEKERYKKIKIIKRKQRQRKKDSKGER